MNGIRYLSSRERRNHAEESPPEAEGHIVEQYERAKQKLSAVELAFKEAEGHIVEQYERAKQKISAVELAFKSENNNRLFDLIRSQRRADFVKKCKFTQRELQVLEKLVLGLVNKQIGHLLGIAEQTVKVNVAGIKCKATAAYQYRFDRPAQLAAMWSGTRIEEMRAEDAGQGVERSAPIRRTRQSQQRMPAVPRSSKTPSP